MSRWDADLARIGHVDGQLVLQFERRLPYPSDLIHQVLVAESSSAQHPDDAIRWEVHEIEPGSRLALTTWIDGEDVDLAAGAGVGYHLLFERLVHTIDPGAAPALVSGAALAALTNEYSAAIAAALADTD